jgi:hypothetical protein
MRSIQELASAFGDNHNKILRGSLHYDRNNCSDKLWTVVGFMRSPDHYKQMFVAYALDAIENNPGEITKHEDIQQVQLNWNNFKDYWDYYVADSRNQSRLEHIIRENLQPDEIKSFDFEKFLNLLVQEEMDEVFHATLAYFFEVYNAQEDIDEDDEEYADSEKEA